MDSSVRFEPMTVGMILDATIRIFTEHFWTLWGVWGVAWIPQLFFLIAAELLGTLADEWSLPLIFLSFLFYIPWFLVLAPFASAAAMAAISQIYLGEAPEPRLAFKAAWLRLPPLIAVNLAVSLIVLVGFVLLFVPGVILWLGLSMATPVVLLEGASFENAIERSWALTRENRIRILAAMTVVVFFQIVVQFGAIGALAVFGLEIQSFPSQIVQRIAGLVLAPLASIVVTLIYYDLKIRKEGFDLELLSRSVAEAPVGLGPAEGA